jgi:hypothetical protein
MFFEATQQQDHVKLFGWSNLKYLYEGESVPTLTGLSHFFWKMRRKGRIEKRPWVYMHFVEGFLTFLITMDLTGSGVWYHYHGDHTY